MRRPAAPMSAFTAPGLPATEAVVWSGSPVRSMCRSVSIPPVAEPGSIASGGRLRLHPPTARPEWDRVITGVPLTDFSG